MIQFEVYRDGNGSIETRIVKATRLFYQAREGQLPASIMVNPTEVGAARAACKALDLEVTVNGCGGCLVPEIWLEACPVVAVGRLNNCEILHGVIGSEVR